MRQGTLSTVASAAHAGQAACGGAYAGGGYSDGTAVQASGTVIATGAAPVECSFAGKRIEGQFIGAASGMVNTIKMHALDFGSACAYQTMMIGAE